MSFSSETVICPASACIHPRWTCRSCSFFACRPNARNWYARSTVCKSKPKGTLELDSFTRAETRTSAAAVTSCPRHRCGRRFMNQSLSPARIQKRLRHRFGSLDDFFNKNPAQRVQLSSLRCAMSQGGLRAISSSSDSSEPVPTSPTKKTATRANHGKHTHVDFI